MTIQGITPDSTTGLATAKSATASSSTDSSSQSSLGSMDTTFMNLLITELQSQDPTAPMDATQMVGQMVSLNQLDQLIAIHQILQNASSSTGTTSAVAGGN